MSLCGMMVNNLLFLKQFPFFFHLFLFLLLLNKQKTKKLICPIFFSMDDDIC